MAKMTTIEFEPPPDWNPQEAIMRGLVAKRDNEPVNESEFEVAAVVMAAQALMETGLDAESAMDQVEKLIENGATIKASLDKHGKLNLTIARYDIEI